MQPQHVTPEEAVQIHQVQPACSRSSAKLMPGTTDRIWRTAKSPLDRSAIREGARELQHGAYCAACEKCVVQANCSMLDHH